MIRDWGFLATALYIGDRLLRGSRVGRIHFYRIDRQPVPDKPLLPPHRGRQFEIRRLEANESALAQTPRPPAVIATRFQQGSVGLGGFQGDALVGMIWLHLGPYPEDEVRCLFVPDKSTAWDFDVYVVPELRSSFLFARLWDTAFTYLREQNIVSTVCRVSAWNQASIQAHRRLGATRLSSAVFIVIGPAQLMLATQAPYCHVSFRRSTATVFPIG
jgi:hypothetical protein